MSAPRLLQFGDVHLDASTKDNVLHALAQILEIAQAERPDVAINTGDLSFKRGHLAPWVALELRRFHCALAEVCPTIVISGNHDLSYSDGVGTVLGALDFSDSNGRIHLAETPRVIRPLRADRGSPFRDLTFAALPYPSRYSLQAVDPSIAPSEVNARASELLAIVLRGLAAEVGDGALLIFHGSLAGARTSSEMEMGTETDIIVREPEIPEAFSAILAGHIHKPQQIGRAYYAGSPTPLSFGEDHEHGVVLWEGGVPRFVELEPKHRLLTLDVRGLDPIDTSNAIAAAPVKGSRVRVLMRISRGAGAEKFVEEARGFMMGLGAVEVRFQIEHAQDDRTVEVGDVRRDLGHAELLAAYAKRVPDAEPMLPDLARVFAEVDAQLPPEARALEQFAEYRLRRIAWQDWKSLDRGELVLDDLGRLVVIEGENATGKSNLIEIESFAVWGKLPRGKVALADLVRNGAQEAWVEAEFEAGGSLWKVRRTVRLNSKGTGVGDLILEHAFFSGLTMEARGGQEIGEWSMTPTSVAVEATATWCPANEGTAAETQRKIEAMVGPYELYLATRFASQGDIDRLIEQTPAERKDTLQAALGTGAFEAREAIAKRMLAAVEKRIEGVTLQADEFRRQAEMLGDLEAELDLAVTNAAARNGFESDAEHALWEANEALEAAKERARAAEEHARRRRELEQRRSDLTARIEALEAERKRCGQAVTGAAKARADLARVADLRGRLPELEAAEAEHRALFQASTDARSGDEAARRDHEQAQREIENLARWQKDQRKALENDRAHKRRERAGELERARAGAERVNKAPFQEKCVEAKCSLLAAAVEDRDRVPSLALAVDQIDAETAELLHEMGIAHGAGIAQAEARAQELGAAHEKAITAHLEAMDALAGYSFDERTLATLRRELRGFDEGQLRHAEAEALQAGGCVSAIEQERSSLIGSVAAVNVDLGALGPAEAVPIVSEMAAVASAEAALTDARTRASEASNRVATLQGKLEVVGGARERLDAAEKALEGHRAEAGVLGVFCRAMGRDGVPFLLLERAVPALERYANEFLGDGITLEVEPFRDLRDGTQKSEVHLKYRDGFGSHPLSAASGYQRASLGVALRAALSHVQAEALGLKVSHWVADEAFSAYDSAHLLDGQQMLNRLAKTFSRILFVSHMSEIREVADSRVRVEANGNGGSHVTVLS